MLVFFRIRVGLLERAFEVGAGTLVKARWNGVDWRRDEYRKQVHCNSDACAVLECQIAWLTTHFVHDQVGAMY